MAYPQLSQRASHESSTSHHRLWPLAIAAIGVVFGDIGTSPLYALRAALNTPGIGTGQTEVLAILSFMIWAITLVVSVKFVWFIMRANNNGEGGVMALVGLVRQVRMPQHRGLQAGLVVLGLFGVGLFFGDAVLTPAVSVLSAVEGIETVAPHHRSLILPTVLALLVGLFASQRLGTGAVGRLFGPVTALWFIALAVSGVVQIARHPDVLHAFSPTYAAAFAWQHPIVTFAAMSAVFLAVTGAEALYADLGHFGHKPIALAWFSLVFPALTLNYLGQGALVLSDPAALADPFFLMFPTWAQLPMVVLATAATLIASQAVITGAFSVANQAVQLGYLPRLTVRHTSHAERGQIYVPSINWILFTLVCGLVLVMGSSSRLAAAYGVAVSITILADTVLFLALAAWQWRKPWWLVAMGAVAMLSLDVVFVSANLTKLTSGGWFPLALGLAVLATLLTWHKGRTYVTASRRRLEGNLQDFVDGINNAKRRPRRLRGSAIYLHPERATTPLALKATLDHFQEIHARVLVVQMVADSVAHVPVGRRLVVDDLGWDDGIAHVQISYGFMDIPDVAEALRQAAKSNPSAMVDPDEATFFLSSLRFDSGGNSRMSPASKALFRLLARNAASPVDYFGLPPDRTVTMSATIAL